MMTAEIYSKYAQLRDDKQLSDYAVAKETNIPRSLFSDWKANRYVPKVDKLKRLADFFQVSVDYFLTDGE